MVVIGAQFTKLVHNVLVYDCTDKWKFAQTENATTSPRRLLLDTERK